MEITREKSGDGLVIRLKGRLDTSWCDTVEAALVQAVREGEHRIRLDMERVDYISSAGLRVVLTVYKQLLAIKGSFGIVNPSTMVRTVLGMAGMEALLQGDSATSGPADEPSPGRTLTSARAGYELFSLAGKGVRVGTLGSDALLHGGFDAATAREAIRFDQGTVAIGVGALGAKVAECAPRFGEFLAAGGVSVFQPADDSARPDFSVSEGTLVPEGHLLLGLVARGDFSTLARFQAKDEARTVGLTELAATALEIATVLAVCAFIGFATGPITVLVTMLFVFGVWVFAGEDGALSRLLDSKPLVTLGRWSFAVYMVHMFVLVVTLIIGRKLHWLPGGRRIDFGSPWLNDLFAIALFAGIVALAVLAHRFVEAPAQRLIDRWTKPKAAQA